VGYNLFADRANDILKDLTPAIALIGDVIDFNETSCQILHDLSANVAEFNVNIFS
jgi:hypothetical protein